MYYHHKKDILFLCQPRTGSVTTSAMLQLAGFSQTPKHHGTFAEARAHFPISDRTEVVATIRNHFDWFVSFAFASQHTIDMMTVEWLKRFCTDNSYWFQPPDTVFQRYQRDVTRTMRFETLTQDIKKLFKDFDLPEIDMQHLNKSRFRADRKYWEFYTCTSRAWVEDRFGAEMERYGYKF